MQPSIRQIKVGLFFIICELPICDGGLFGVESTNVRMRGEEKFRKFTLRLHLPSNLSEFLPISYSTSTDLSLRKPTHLLSVEWLIMPYF